MGWHWRYWWQDIDAFLEQRWHIPKMAVPQQATEHTHEQRQDQDTHNNLSEKSPIISRKGRNE
jgi:hypothetical protein